MFGFIRQAHQQLSASEKKLACGLIMVMLLLSSLPVLASWGLTPPSLHFTGFLGSDGTDLMVYFSEITEAARGQLLLHNLYTAEGGAAMLFSPLWLVLGGVSAITHLSALVVFQVARLAAGGLFLYLVYLFISRLFAPGPWRKVCFLAVGLSSGWGIFSLVGQLAGGAASLPVDLWVPESNTFLTLTHSALFIMSQGLILLILWWSQERLAAAAWPETLAMGLVTLGLGLIHPYDLVIIFSVLAGWWVINCLTSRRILMAQAARLAIIAAVAGLAVVYFKWLLNNDQGFAVWTEQNVTLSPAFWQYAAGWGMVFLFFIIGWPRSLVKPNHWRLLAIWAVVGLIILYWPIQFQRRLVNGLHLPLVLVATLGFKWVWQRLPAYSCKVLLAGLTIFLLVLTTLFNISSVIADSYTQAQGAATRLTYAYLPDDMYQAMNWLNRQASSQEVVLSSYYSGLFIPAYGGVKVYVGHWHQTGQFSVKRQQVEQWFFVNNSQDAEKLAWLNSRGITYLFWGPAEQALGSYNPDLKNYWRQVYRHGRVAIYQLN